MFWIEEMLQIYGYINREHLVRKFGVSIQQASIDLNRFKRLYPDRISYDLTAKRYIANGEDSA